jgi:GAF domain-containing protein
VPKDSLEAHVVAANEVLVSEDIEKDARFADDPLVLEKGIRFYAGAPLRTSSGPVIGSVCLVDTRPRQFAERDRERLQQMADELMAQIEDRAKKRAAHPQDLVPPNNPSKGPA